MRLHVDLCAKYTEISDSNTYKHNISHIFLK